MNEAKHVTTDFGLTRGGRVRLLVLAALILAYLVLQPWYRNYREKYYTGTCNQAILEAVWAYQTMRQEREAAGQEITREWMMNSIQEAFENTLDCTLSPTDNGYVIEGVCHEGGTVRAEIEDLSEKKVHFYCDLEEHGDFTFY